MTSSQAIHHNLKTILGILILLTTCFACSQKALKPIWTEPEEKPDWVIQSLHHTDKQLMIRGYVAGFTSKDFAREAAQNDCFRQAAAAIGTQIDYQAVQIKKQVETLNPPVELRESIEQNFSNLQTKIDVQVRQLEFTGDEYYEAFEKENGDVVYDAYILAHIPRKIIKDISEELIQNLREEIDHAYAELNEEKTAWQDRITTIEQEITQINQWMIQMSEAYASGYIKYAVIVLDNSSSMNEEGRFDLAKRAIQKLSNDYPNTHLGLVTFQEANTIQPSLDHPTQLLPKLNQITAEGNTSPIGEAFQQAETLLKQLPDDGRKAIILLTDGWEYRSDVPVQSVATRILEENAIQRIDVVAFSMTDELAQYARMIAETCLGNFWNISSESELINALK